MTVYHWYYDSRTKGWFKDHFGSTNFDPIATVMFDGDSEDDRVCLIGSETGYVHAIDIDATDDVGTAIVSEVVVGPLLGEERAPLLLTSIQLVSDQNGDGVQYEVATGDTPEKALAAFASPFVGTDTMCSGISFYHNPRVRGHTLYVKLGSPTGGQWGLEKLLAVTSSVISANHGRSRDNPA